ncbi:hypothetical protein THASP1DRAFT_32318 [Thamnocephalis sphaerospora]|uniref:Uncharacterized protein n=1 Tax=Thamnocephalis sphaerospora TaxID=78915 RepID=A0A4P9XJC0_9FUNG|nr:hypothetical protein THASP1DRAFT_32318 [Thamnocephalis sphaerospora]|eukprot:RKP05854.1 hypothetical protein THASP1DRAFT_32318 [Thamnocephalis sphaerospora]
MRFLPLLPIAFFVHTVLATGAVQNSVSKLARAEDGCPKDDAEIHARCVRLVRGVEASLPEPIIAHAVRVISARKPVKNTAAGNNRQQPPNFITPARLKHSLRRRAHRGVSLSRRSSAGLQEFFHFKWLHKVKGALTVTRDRILDWITEEETNELTSTLQSNLNQGLATEIPSLASRPTSPSNTVMSQLSAEEQAMLSAMAAQSTTEYANTLMTLLNGQALDLAREDIKILFKQFVRHIRSGVGLVPMMKDLGQHAVRLLRHTAAALVGATHALLLFSLPIAISTAISSVVVATLPALSGFYKFSEPYVIANLYVLVDRTISPVLSKLQERLQVNDAFSDLTVVVKETEKPSTASTTVPAGAEAMVTDTKDADQLEADLTSFKRQK